MLICCIIAGDFPLPHIYALSLTFFSIHDSIQFEDDVVHVSECSSVAVLDTAVVRRCYSAS